MHRYGRISPYVRTSALTKQRPSPSAPARRDCNGAMPCSNSPRALLPASGCRVRHPASKAIARWLAARPDVSVGRWVLEGAMGPLHRMRMRCTSRRLWRRFWRRLGGQAELQLVRWRNVCDGEQRTRSSGGGGVLAAAEVGAAATVLTRRHTRRFPAPPRVASRGTVCPVCLKARGKQNAQTGVRVCVGQKTAGKGGCRFARVRAPPPHNTVARLRGSGTVAAAAGPREVGAAASAPPGHAPPDPSRLLPAASSTLATPGGPTPGIVRPGGALPFWRVWNTLSYVSGTVQCYKCTV